MPALSGQLHDAAEQLREADRHVEEARREAETARDRAASLERALAEARERATSLERDAERAQESLEAAGAERDALAAALQAKDARLAELAADGASLEEALSAARADAADTARRRDEADEDMSLVRARLGGSVAFVSPAQEAAYAPLAGSAGAVAQARHVDRTSNLCPRHQLPCDRQANPPSPCFLALAARGCRRGGSGGGTCSSRGGDHGAQ